MARNHENNRSAQETLDGFGRQHESLKGFSLKQKAAALGLVAATAFGVVSQANNNEELKKQTSIEADESFVSEQEASSNTKRIGNKLLAAIEDEEVTAIYQTAEEGDSYSTLREAAMERMFDENGQAVKGAEGSQFTPLQLELIQELDEEEFPKVGDEVIVGIIASEEFTEEYNNLLDSYPVTVGEK